MARPPLVSLCAIAAACGSAVSAAEDRPPVFAPVTPPPLATSLHATSTPPPPRHISPVAASRLAAAGPKFEAPAPTSVTAKPLAPGVDLREVDKPRNTIIRLPSYLVQEKEPPKMQPREMLTPPERLRVALKKFPGLRFGSIGPFSNDGVALMMLAEEERLDRMREMNDLLSLLPATEQKSAKPMVDDAFLRKDLPR